MKTHYDVLNLEKNCSAGEIKDSFIKLSKKYHPDKNKSSEAHKKFVEVNEAYSVLGKSSTRHRYDETLSAQNVRVEHNHYNTRSTTKTPYEYYAEMYAANLRRHQGDTSRAYFTSSKLAAVFFCCLLMAFGSGLHLLSESHRRAVRSKEIATMFREVQNRAKRLGRAQILKEIEERALENKIKGKEPPKE